MKTLLIVTAVLEGATGVVLLLSSSILVLVLFGAALDTPSGLVVARIAGAALLALATGCWLARNDTLSRAATALNAGLLLYNVAAVAVLLHAGMGLGLVGIGLWPTVVFHAALAAWCVACLWRPRVGKSARDKTRR